MGVIAYVCLQESKTFFANLTSHPSLSEHSKSMLTIPTTCGLYSHYTKAFGLNVFLLLSVAQHEGAWQTSHLAAMLT